MNLRDIARQLKISIELDSKIGSIFGCHIRKCQANILNAWQAANFVKARINGKESFAVSLVRLAGNNLINSDLYCQQLNRLIQAIDQKPPGLANKRDILFHQDNVRPQTATADIDPSFLLSLAELTVYHLVILKFIRITYKFD